MSGRQLTQWGRAHLPARLVRGTRIAATAWGQATARARMKPEFLIVGAQRCGTTTLYRLLEEHPNVVRPTFSKGIGFFDLNYTKGMAWYLSHFPLDRLAQARRPARGPLKAFESSGYYMYHPDAAGRIAEDLPGVQLVVLVRDPVERAYSAHRHELARGYETLPFGEAIRREPERLRAEEAAVLQEPTLERFHHRHHSYLARGRYAEQVRRLRSAVGDERVYVMDADSFFTAPQTEFTALTDWLDLPRHVPTGVKPWNARPRDPMPTELRNELSDYFAPYDADLATLIGRQVSWRSSTGQRPG